MKALLLLLFIVCSCSSSTVRTPTFPGAFAVTDDIEFYYLQGVAPYNLKEYSFLQQNVLSDGSITHAGIGVGCRARNIKFSIELVAPAGNYIDIFFPNTTVLTSNGDSNGASTGVIDWNNTGEFMITNPLNASAWSDATLFATGKGHSYTELTAYLTSLSLVLQPLSVVHQASSAACMYTSLVCR